MWLEKFNDLKDFYKRNGHAQVAKSNCSDKSLVKWVHDQRHHCKIDERIKLLDSIEFVWSPLGFQEEQWLENFNELKDFYKTNGHAKVTEANCTDKTLVEWVKTQRKRCVIEKRIKLLDSIEFIWSFSEMREDQWLEIFNKLKEFHSANGHAKVTKTNCADKSLVCWVGAQRYFCKIDGRIKLLNSVGFVWPESRGATGENPDDVGKTFDDF